MAITQKEKEQGGIECPRCKAVIFVPTKYLRWGEHIHCLNCSAPIYIWDEREDK